MYIYIYAMWRIVWLPTKYTLDRSHLPIRGELRRSQELTRTERIHGAFENAAFDRRALCFTWASSSSGWQAARERIECGARARADRILQFAGARMSGTTRRNAARERRLYVENIRG